MKLIRDNKWWQIYAAIVGSGATQPGVMGNTPLHKGQWYDGALNRAIQLTDAAWKHARKFPETEDGDG